MDKEIEAFLDRYVAYCNARIAAMYAELDNAKNEYPTCQRCYDKQREELRKVT